MREKNNYYESISLYERLLQISCIGIFAPLAYTVDSAYEKDRPFKPKKNNAFKNSNALLFFRLNSEIKSPFVPISSNS